jgi:hypothetical protein
MMRGSRPFYRRKAKKHLGDAFVVQVLSAAMMVGAVVFIAAPQLQKSVLSSTTMLDKIEQTERSAYYRNCAAARAAGAAPIRRGSPGYRSEMDGDSDGVACEPVPY